MIEIQNAIFARLNNDTALRALLGGAGRIRYAFGVNAAQAGALVFKSLGDTPGQIDSDAVKTLDDLWQFDFYGENGQEVAYRIRTLLDGHRFSSNAQTAGFSMHFSVGLPDDFDDELKVPMKSVRYRVLAVPVGVAQV